MNTTTNYGITNGDGTIEYLGFSSLESARRSAQSLADEHDQHFWVFVEGGGQVVEAVAPDGYEGPTPAFSIE